MSSSSWYVCQHQHKWSSVHSCLAPGYVYNSKVHQHDWQYETMCISKWSVLKTNHLHFVIWDLLLVKVWHHSGWVILPIVLCILRSTNSPVVKLKLIYYKILCLLFKWTWSLRFILVNEQAFLVLEFRPCFEASLITFDQVSEYTWLSIRFSSVQVLKLNYLLYRL